MNYQICKGSRQVNKYLNKVYKVRRVIKQSGELHEGHLTRWGREGGSFRRGSGEECAGKEKSGKTDQSRAAGC